MTQSVGDVVPMATPEVVELLQGMLRLAKRGEVTGIAVAMIGRTDGTGTAYHVNTSDSERLVGMLEACKMRIALRFMVPEDDSAA